MTSMSSGSTAGVPLDDVDGGTLGEIDVVDVGGIVVLGRVVTVMESSTVGDGAAAGPVPGTALTVLLAAPKPAAFRATTRK